MDKTSKQFHSVCIYLLLALATLAAYWQVRNHDFINYDDSDYVYFRPKKIIQELKNSLTPAGFKERNLLLLALFIRNIIMS